MIRVRPSKDVLATGTGTRRRTFSVAGHRHTLEFGKEPIYLDLESIPVELGQDPHLLIREVTPDEMHAAAGTLTPLIIAEPEESTGEETDLKSERLQEPAASAPPPSAEGGQPEPAATTIAEPESGAGEETDLKSERLQEEAPATEPAAFAVPPSAEGASSFSPGHRPGPPTPPSGPRPAKAKPRPAKSRK